jgi:hypothetical protein
MAFSSGPDFEKEMKMLEGVTKTVVSKSTLATIVSEHTSVLRGQVKVRKLVVVGAATVLPAAHS